MKAYRYLIIIFFVTTGIIVYGQAAKAVTSCYNFNGEVGDTCTLTVETTDPEGNQVYYLINWNEPPPGQTRVPEYPAFAQSGEQVSVDHTWSHPSPVGPPPLLQQQPWTIHVLAYDEANNVKTDTEGNLLDATTTVYISSTELSASFIESETAPLTSGWYNDNDNTFNYKASCHADSGNKLDSCVLEVQAINCTLPEPSCEEWQEDGASQLLDNICVGQKSCEYTGSFTYPENGAGYRFRVKAVNQATPSTTAFSATIPEDGEINYDKDYPLTSLSNLNPITASPFNVTATFYDYPNPQSGPNSGISSWDLEYSVDGGINYGPCKLNKTIENSPPWTSDFINFPSGCLDADPPAELVHNTNYCFKAKARDSTSPTPPNDGPYSDPVCTTYKESQEPVIAEPHTPANDALISNTNRPDMTWFGGDPDGDQVTYKVYIWPASVDFDPELQPDQYLDGSVKPLTTCTDPCLINYGPAKGILDLGQSYKWKVSAYDGFNTVWGPVWNFKVNSKPTVWDVAIDRGIVNTTATITWKAQDADDQNLTFVLSYGPDPDNTPIAISIEPPGIICNPESGAGVRVCSYEWKASCTDQVLAPPQYVSVVADDGVEPGEHASSTADNTFIINHTETKYFPSQYGFDTVTDDDPVDEIYTSKDFTIGTGSIKGQTSYITYANPNCAKISADANALGDPTSCGYAGTPACDSGQPLALNGLQPGSNSIQFQFSDCSSYPANVDYRIQYDLMTACDKPYVSVEQGSIYSQGSIKAQYAPPPGSYNASYLILGGGSGSVTPISIENFISGYNPEDQPQGNESLPVNPNFGQLLYPGSSDTSLPRVSSFDYYGLTHDLNGNEVENLGKNSYGHTVRVISGSNIDEDVFTMPDIFLGKTQASLDGMVYWVKGSLKIDETMPAFTFKNGDISLNPPKPGAGLFIVERDLIINNNLYYQATFENNTNSRNLASVGWLVRGNVEMMKEQVITKDVINVVGAFFVAGDTGDGTFSTGNSNSPLEIYGAVIAKKFNFQRETSTAIEPSEKVVADGRLMLNTPPGFTDIISTLPTWRFRTPEP